MPFWLRATIAYIVVSVLLVAGFGTDLPTSVGLVILACSAIPSIIRRSPKLYLAFQRARFYLLNTETTWELALQFRGPADVDKVSAFIQMLVAGDPQGTTLLQSSTKRWLLRYRRIFTLEFLVNESDEINSGQALPTGMPASVDVTLFEQQVGYRRSKAMLEENLIPLIEQLRDALHPDSSSYALRVRFAQANPFFGMYLEHLAPALVREFQVEFTLPSGGPGDYVRVDREKMVVWSGSVECFRRAALAGLTFSAAAR